MRQRDEQESNHPILPSHQTRQGPFQAMDMEYLIRVIFVLVGMDRIAILVDHPKVGGPMNLIFPTRSFDYRKRRFFCKRQWRGVNSTPHRARFHTRQLFSRVAQGSSCSDFFVSTAVILARMLCFALCLSLHLSHPHSALPTSSSSSSSSTSSSSLLYPPNTTNTCAPKPGLLFGRFVEESPLTDSSGTQDPTPTRPKDCKA